MAVNNLSFLLLLRRFGRLLSVRLSRLLVLCAGAWLSRLTVIMSGLILLRPLLTLTRLVLSGLVFLRSLTVLTRLSAALWGIIAPLLFSHEIV